MAERSADWMAQARRDLEHARHDLDEEFFEWACFSAQQAAEKAAKAVLQRQGAVAWGHSIASLLQAVTVYYPVDKEFIQAAQELDKVYIPTRYPDAHVTGSPHELYTKTEAERHINYADQILRFCEGLLS